MAINRRVDRYYGLAQEYLFALCFLECVAFARQDIAATPQVDRAPLSNATNDPIRSLVKCYIVPDYRTKEGARTVSAGLSSASRENVQKNRRFGRLVENRCQTRLSRYFSNDIPKLHSNSAHSTSADNTATPPPTDRVPLSNENRAEKSARLKCG